MGDFPSGQRGQTVNLLSIDFGGPNPPSPTKKKTPYFYGVFLFWCEIDGKADEQRTASGGAAAPSPIPSSTDADGMLLNRSRVHQKKTGFNLSFLFIAKAMVYHHAQACITSPKVYHLSQWWYTRHTSRWYTIPAEWMIYTPSAWFCQAFKGIRKYKNIFFTALSWYVP